MKTIFNAKKRKTVSCFEKIDLSRIEFVSFFNTNGDSSHALRDQINHKLIQTKNDASLFYAFVNMIGGDFIIVHAHTSE